MARREFHFTEGTSNKFWTIELEEKSFTVRFGRIGTDGQAQTKEFASAAEATKAHDKLVAEKVKKGYQETGGGSSPASGTETPTEKPAKTHRVAKQKVAAEPPAQPEEPKSQAPVPPAAMAIDVVRRLHLSQSELTLKTGEAVQRPEPRPFDRDACLNTLARVTSGTNYYTGWDWSAAEIPESMTVEEAAFWLHVMLHDVYPNTPRKLVKEMKDHAFKNIPSVTEIRESINQSRSSNLLIGLPLAHLMSPEDMFDWIAELFDDQKKQAQVGWDHGRAMALVQGFSGFVRPCLSDKQLETMRKQVSDHLDLTFPWPPNDYQPFPFECYMAAALGMTKDVRQIVARISDTTYAQTSAWSNYYQNPQFLILRLGDAATVEAEMRRTKLLLRGLGQIRCWLAVTEWNALDVVRDSILDVGKREEVEALIEGFGQAIEAPEAAVTMLELKLHSKAPNFARQWLDQHLGCAIAGLIPVAAGKGKLAEAAVDFLGEKKRQGHAKLIAKLLKETPGEAADKVRQEVLEREEIVYSTFDGKSLPGWFQQAAADLKAPKSADWLPVVSLPPILIEGKRLGDEQVGQVLAALQKSTIEKKSQERWTYGSSSDGGGNPPHRARAPRQETSSGEIPEHPLLPALKKHADTDALDAFAWAVFDYWLTSGAPSKDKWGMMVIGFLGGDRSVLKITPLIRAWPGESQHQRAVLGLQCLRRVGTDTALMQLNGIAQKLKFKGLKENAARFMEEIAKDKGLTRAQLEDRIVPACDLDERGGHIFDFGPRQFRFVLGPQLKPMIKDDSGGVKTDLPKPGAKDDAERAGQAVAHWKLLKKQVSEVVKIQAVRLEQAMVTGRRWPVNDFQTLLVRHPLMINLVRQLVWGVYDAKGAIKKTFRVTEDQTCADAQDKEWQPAADDMVGIVHPLQLLDADKSAWGEVFGDYEILPPFPQLGRPTYALEKGEEKGTEITRFAKVKIPPQSLVFGLEKLGWARGPAADAGVFDEHLTFRTRQPVLTGASGGSYRILGERGMRCQGGKHGRKYAF